MTDAKRAQKVLHSVKAHGIIHSRHGAFGKRLSHSPLKAVSRVRIPYALPLKFQPLYKGFFYCQILHQVTFAILCPGVFSIQTSVSFNSIFKSIPDGIFFNTQKKACNEWFNPLQALEY